MSLYKKHLLYTNIYVKFGDSMYYTSLYTINIFRATEKFQTFERT